MTDSAPSMGEYEEMYGIISNLNNPEEEEEEDANVRSIASVTTGENDDSV